MPPSRAPAAATVTEGPVVVRAAGVVLPTGVTGPAEVEVDDGRVVAVRPAVGDVPPRTLVPGFIDLQVNGIDDVDVATARDDDWDRLDGLLLRQGVTTWCPTLVTSPMAAYAAPLLRAAVASDRPGARPTLAGVHLEGPFLGVPGAHPPELLRAVDDEFVQSLPDVVRMVTLAPEVDGAVEAVALLAQRGVLVALGHTAATAAQADAAVRAGARMVTHVFNGMPPFHHRTPGPAGWALLDDRLTVSIVADGVHVAADAVRLAFRVKGPGRVVLVTDAVAWRSGRVGPVGLRLVDGAPRLPDGTLAGSALTMDAAVRFAVREAGVPLHEAVAAASTVPARLLGLGDRGRIAPGARADLVALDEHLAVEGVWLGGRPVVVDGLLGRTPDDAPR